LKGWRIIFAEYTVSPEIKIKAKVDFDAIIIPVMSRRRRANRAAIRAQENSAPRIAARPYPPREPPRETVSGGNTVNDTGDGTVPFLSLLTRTDPTNRSKTRAKRVGYYNFNTDRLDSDDGGPEFSDSDSDEDNGILYAVRVLTE
jgi:hypothetical protein